MSSDRTSVTTRTQTSSVATTAEEQRRRYLGTFIGTIQGGNHSRALWLAMLQAPDPYDWDQYSKIPEIYIPEVRWMITLVKRNRGVSSWLDVWGLEFPEDSSDESARPYIVRGIVRLDTMTVFRFDA